MGQFLGTMAAVCLVIAAFVISSTLSVSVSQRRRELALLRAVGASSGRVRALVVGEAVLVGGLAGVAGALGGVGLASAGLRFFANQGLIPRSLPLTPDPTSFLAGAGVAVVTAAVAGTLPAWRASRIEPGEALRAAELPPRRTGAGRRLWGLVSLAAGVGLLLVSMAVAAPVNTPRGAIAVSTLFVSVPFLLLAVALLGPVLIRGVVGVVAGPLRTCFGGFMASRSVQADLRRAAGVAVPITVMVATASILLFQDSTTFVAKSRNYGQRLEADLVVAGPHQVGVPSVISDRLAGVPGVRAASGVVSTQIFVVGQNDEASYAEAMGVSPNAISQVLRLPVVSGSWSAFTEGTLAVSQETATTQGWSAGGNINYRLPDGTPATGRVAVVYESDATFANVLLPRSELLPHLREPFDTAVYMTLASGVDRATVERELRRVIHPVPGLVLTSRSEHLEQMAAQSTGDNWIVSLFVVLIGGYAGISAINVLVGSTNGQRRQFALLRLAGARRGHVLSWVTVEAAVSVVTGILWGSLISGAVMCGYARLLTGTFWVPLPLAPYLLICCAAVAVGMVGSLVPARLAMRARPLEAMSTT
ncbi:ABC transporter permease [Streptoalloteichus tenebrarius]|nr:FtsX-like permease family protein [Streptoalloteichus tenebrarius]